MSAAWRSSGRLSEERVTKRPHSPPLERAACFFGHQRPPERLFERPDWWLGCPGDFAWMRCPQCGLHFLSPRPPLADIAAYYPEHYAAYRGAIDRERWRLMRWKRRRNLYPAVRAIAGFFTQPGSLLDVGCATGNYLAEMRRRGWRVQGVEIQPEAAAYARQALGLDVFTGDLLDAPFNRASFDAITLWDVLEHTHDPLAILRAAGHLLKPGGVLAFSVPDLQSADAALFDKYWIGFDAPRHLFLFEEQTMSLLLREARLEYLGRSHFLGTYHTWLAALQTWLNAQLPEGALRRGLARLAGLPWWAPLSAPYFALLNRRGKGSVVTIFARAAHEA